MRVVVAGASGFVGHQLVRLLLARGHEVRCGTRHPGPAERAHPDRTWVRLDVEDAGSLRGAFDGADALVYLVHQMRDGSGKDLVALEEACARRVAEAATGAGLRRIVYLGGPAPREGPPSKHLLARLRTGEILRGGTVSAVELRAPMIVGAGSQSWKMVRDLALRLPVMVLPAWLSRRSQPIAIDDVAAALAAALQLDLAGSAWYDLPGPETLSARDILERVAALRDMRPYMLPVPVLTPRLSSHWIRFVSGADYEIARQLVDGLSSDLLATGEGFWSVAPTIERTPFDDAARAALQAEDRGAGGWSARTWERIAHRVSRRPA